MCCLPLQDGGFNGRLLYRPDLYKEATIVNFWENYLVGNAGKSISTRVMCQHRNRHMGDGVCTGNGEQHLH